jgi:hypothetical protein
MWDLLFDTTNFYFYTTNSVNGLSRWLVHDLCVLPNWQHVWRSNVTFNKSHTYFPFDYTNWRLRWDLVEVPNLVVSTQILVSEHTNFRRRAQTFRGTTQTFVLLHIFSRGAVHKLCQLHTLSQIKQTSLDYTKFSHRAGGLWRDRSCESRLRSQSSLGFVVGRHVVLHLRSLTSHRSGLGARFNSVRPTSLSWFRV